MTVDEAGGSEARTLARFERHRRAWQSNPALRTLYARWYGRVRAALPPRSIGPFVEIGSGPGFAHDFIPELELSDIVQAPWHQHRIAADALPFPAHGLGALVLFDVLHHLPSPAAFFAEASRTLAPGGRLIVCEPYLSLLSRPVYTYLHEEGADASVDPFAPVAAGARGGPGAEPSIGASKDPFDGNQAIPTLLLERRRAELEARFPRLRLLSFDRLAGPSYPASGGFSRGPLLPWPLWRGLLAIEDRLPPALFRWVGFRLLAVFEAV